MDNASLVEEKGASVQKALDEIRRYISRSLKDLHIAGTGVAIIKDNDVILCEGFGHRDVEQGLPVTPDTLFAIGSSTKAFTTMSVGILVDNGKVDWDTPVSTYLPEFKLHDKYASENTTHRVGLPRHEVVWYKAPLSREEIIRRLSYLPLTKPFRTTFQYQNMMYVTLGYLVEKISGQPWESFVQAQILDVLGMRRSNFSVNVWQQDDDYAMPYKVIKQEIRETAFANVDAMGPAGSINSSATDMAEWVKLHLGKGKVHESRLISEHNLTQMHSPQISTGPSQDDHVLFPSYGMGWFTEVYRGHHVVHHGGNIDGFSAMVAKVPKENLGVVVLSNQQDSVFPEAATYTIFDALLGLSTVDWNLVKKEQFDMIIASMKESAGQGQGESDRVPETKPSHDLSAYVGEFEHPAYGTISTTSDDDRIFIGYHVKEEPLPLEHLHYDVFSLTIGEGDITQKFKVQFHTDLRGEIARLAIQFEPGLDPFEFARRAAVNQSLEMWKKYTGDFDLAGMTATVALRGDSTLTFTVPGQPTYELVPISDTKFDIKGLPGFEVQFVIHENGDCLQAKFKQPNGTFMLNRRVD